jgi:hypothetical protein
MIKVVVEEMDGGLTSCRLKFAMTTGLDPKLHRDPMR